MRSSLGRVYFAYAWTFWLIKRSTSGHVYCEMKYLNLRELANDVARSTVLADMILNRL